MIEKCLKGEEKIILSLRSLYSSYGYLPYKMNKFEEYDLYAKNKDFLVSDGVITFTDTNGKLLALKPDVTLSIIKNTTDKRGEKDKVYYSENVYRISGSTRQYKELMQTGLECVGDIDLYDLYEVVSLSAKSLEIISSDYVLELSHMGILSALLDEISSNEGFKTEIAECIKKKSGHEISKICQKYEISSDKARVLESFVTIYGSPSTVLEKLSSMKVNSKFDEAVSELVTLNSLLSTTKMYDKIRIDFSIVNDMNYYNGIVFNGFINGICECVLFGGRYDKLLSKMNKNSKGVGFAIYIDLLEGLEKSARSYDVDVLLLYKDTTSCALVQEKAQKLINEGKSVSAQKTIPQKLRYKELIEI